MGLVALLLRYWKYIAMLAALLFVLVAIHGWMERECARRELALKQTYEKLLDAERERVRQTEQKWRTLVHEVERAHQHRLQAVEAKYRDAERRIGAVRVCQQPGPSGPRLPRDPAPPAVDPDPAGGDRFSGPAGGRDIGPGLVALARAAETQTARLIACQEYVRTLGSAR